ncbi:MAG: response regulator transcription factor [Kofleriaceae bacterium]
MGDGVAKDRVFHKVLAVDDNEVYLNLLVRALGYERRFPVFTALDSTTAYEIALRERPDFGIVDLQLKDESGIDLIRALKLALPSMFITLCSAYVSSEVAIAAIRAGADDVVHKAASAHEILLRAEGTVLSVRDLETPSLELVEWEHITRVVAECGGNISEAARRLRINRTSVQRRLKRPAPTS